MPTRRFEFEQGKSNKFWQISQSGKKFTVQYGRLGSDGQTNVKEFDSPAQAKAAAEKLVSAKLAKGYVEVGSTKKRMRKTHAKRKAAKATRSRSGSTVQRLARWLEDNRPEYYKSLRKGVAQSKLNAFEKQLGQKLPKEFVELYRWRDGQHLDAEPLINNDLWMPLGEVISSWKMLSGMYRNGQWPEPVWWNDLWVPFLLNPGGDHLCVDLRGSFTKVKGQIVNFYHDWERRTIEAKSFSNWLKAVVNSLEGGGWKIEEYGNFESPRDDYLKLSGYPKYENAKEPDWYESARLKSEDRATKQAMGKSRQLVLDAHSDCINKVLFSPDGKLLYSGALDYQIKIWDVKTGKLKKRLNTTEEGNGAVYSIALSPNGKTLVSADAEHYSYDLTDIKIWDISAARVKRKLKVGELFNSNCVAISPDGKTVAGAVELDKWVALWSMSNGKQLWKRKLGYVGEIGFSPDGKTLAVVNEDHREVILLHTKSGRTKLRLPQNVYLTDVLFATDHQLVLGYRYHSSCVVWDVTANEAMATLKGTRPAFAISNDRQLMATGSGKNNVKLWNVASYKAITTLKGLKTLPGSIAFSPDGKMLAASDQKRILVWDIS